MNSIGPVDWTWMIPKSFFDAVDLPEVNVGTLLSIRRSSEDRLNLEMRLIARHGQRWPRSTNFHVSAGNRYNTALPLDSTSQSFLLLSESLCITTMFLHDFA